MSININLSSNSFARHKAIVSFLFLGTIIYVGFYIYIPFLTFELLQRLANIYIYIYIKSILDFKINKNIICYIWWARFRMGQFIIYLQRYLTTELYILFNDINHIMQYEIFLFQRLGPIHYPYAKGPKDWAIYSFQT